MSFTVNTNILSLKAYNALAEVNSQTEKAQLRLATLKKINSVSDDTSGYNVCTSLEAQTIRQQAQLNNVASAQNYVSTAETALQQVNDKLNEISSKYIDSQDSLKDKSTIADDIRTIAGEIDSIMKNTNINGTNLLAQSNGSALASSPEFDISGTDFEADFASDDYLKADDLNALLQGGASTDAGVSSISGSLNYYGLVTVADGTSTVKVTFADGTSSTIDVTLSSISNNEDLISSLVSAIDPTEDGDGILYDTAVQPSGDTIFTITSGYYDSGYHYSTNNIVSLETTSGYDITTALGITRTSSGSSSGDALLSSDDSEVLAAASSISDVSSNVQASLSRIGNLSQTLDSRSEFLTAAIANNSATISSLSDADVAEEQLNATKGSIASQIGTTILSQFNTAPQNLLALFS